jgi:hypothetical protein
VNPFLIFRVLHGLYQANKKKTPEEETSDAIKGMLVFVLVIVLPLGLFIAGQVHDAYITSYGASRSSDGSNWHYTAPVQTPQPVVPAPVPFDNEKNEKYTLCIQHIPVHISQSENNEEIAICQETFYPEPEAVPCCIARMERHPDRIITPPHVETPATVPVVIVPVEATQAPETPVVEPKAEPLPERTYSPEFIQQLCGSNPLPKDMADCERK